MTAILTDCSENPLGVTPRGGTTPRRSIEDGAARNVPRPHPTAGSQAVTHSAKWRASDLLILPSRHEAFGIVFLEAWAAGTAVLGADMLSTREVIGNAGMTSRPDNAVDLVAKIDAALADPAERVRQGARGRQRIVAAHTWDRVGLAVEAAYRESLGEHA